MTSLPMVLVEEGTVEETLKNYPAEMAWAVVQAKNQAFAVATRDLREMVIMPEVSEVPNTGQHVRGVINLRGRVLPLIDLRKRIGLASLAEENAAFSAMLEQREKDHQNWLHELEASVRERREFRLTTDPHKCAFGKWYDTYKPESTLVAMQLKKFDQPHQQIHGVAVEVAKLMTEGQADQAQTLIEETRSGVLARLVALFAELRSLMSESKREIALIVEDAGKSFAISADSALSVEKLATGSIETLQSGVGVVHGGVVQRFGKRTKTGEIILILESDRLRDGVEFAEG
jgi:chemotaxis signal transduction protein